MRIAMHRGDIHYERFIIKDPTGTYTDIDFDEIYFTVKKTPKDRPYLFQKVLSNGSIEKLDIGDYQLKIEPEDTNSLPYGRYVFDINIKYLDIIDESFVGIFDLLEEVTFAENEV